MREEQSLVSLKRQQFRVELRKKELTNYFQKRRIEMLSDKHIGDTHDLQDSQRCHIIIMLINKFSVQKLPKLLSKIIEVDNTLSLFFRLTGFKSESPPAFFKQVLEMVMGVQIQSKMVCEEHTISRTFSNDEKNELLEIWREMQTIWKKQSQDYINIISLLKRVQNVDLLIRSEIIQFLSVSVNVFLMLRKLASILGIDTTQRTLVGEIKFMSYQISSTTTLLINILSGNDELLQPFINDVLQANGWNPQLLGLYYNMLLIQKVDNKLKLKMLHFLTCLLSNQRQWFLDDHKEIIETLSVGLKVLPELKDQQQKKAWQTVGQKIIDLLSGLLTVINMRFDNFSGPFVESDIVFLNSLASILYKLSESQLIRSLMESSSITLFMVNHLIFTQVGSELKVVQYCLRILINATRDHYSIHFFLNEEPRLLLRVLSLFQKYLKIKFQKLSAQQCSVLKAIIVLIRDLSLIGKVAQRFIEENILNKVCYLYFRVQGSSQNSRFLRQKIEHIYLILVKYAKDVCSGIEHFYQFFLKEKEIMIMLLNMFKYTPQRKIILNESFQLLTHIIYSCGEVSQFQTIKQTILNSSIAFQLAELENCPEIKISMKASQTLKLIERFHYVKGQANIYDYDQEQY